LATPHFDIRLPGTLRNAAQADWAQLGDITGEAFADDPVNRWIFGKPAAITATFRLLAREVYLRRGICHLAGDRAAAMWCASDANRQLSPWPLLQLASRLAIQGSRGAVGRAIGAGEIMEHEHPKEPHLYLFTIGTRANARGTGLGKALLAPVLAAADRTGFACYLENSNPANTGFYVGHGFERTKLFGAGPGGPPLEAMWRRPK
jgi:ribosomal protein S18 acetylase RimI-like enzyme